MVESSLLAQRVEIITENGPVIGVIGSIPPHLLSDEVRNKPMDIKNMLIDIGADDKEDAQENRHSSGSTNCSDYVRSHQWQTIRKFLRKLGITAMVVDLQLNC